MSTGFSLRPATVADAPDFARVRRAVQPFLVTTEPGMRLRLSEALADGVAAVAAVDDLTVGTVVLRHAREGRHRLTVYVDPPARGAGIGSALLDWALQRRSEAVLAVVDDDPASRAFATGSGFELLHDHRVAGCDPRLVEAGDRPADVEQSSLRDVGVVAVHEVYDACAADDPSGLSERMALEEFERTWWGDPDFDPDLSQGLLVDGGLAAFSAVDVDAEHGVAWSGMTATRPTHRGRGLAGWAKRATLRALADAGFARAHTANDASNAPMLAVNAALGYRPIARTWTALLPAQAPVTPSRQ